MKRFGIAGWSGSGKTTLLSRLIPELVGRHLRISTIKHSHHAFEIDQPGKDSHTHRHCGATEVLVGCPQRWALIHENRHEPEASLDDLIARMTSVDLILIEGFKALPHAKMEVHRHGADTPLLCHHNPTIVALVSDSVVADIQIPQFSLDSIKEIADFIVTYCDLETPQKTDSRANTK